VRRFFDSTFAVPEGHHTSGTGDIQPFLALGKRLVQCGHRVRVATHETFRSFVKEASLEFFNIGGDPKDLMSYMVKSKSTFMSRFTSFNCILRT
jgi:UDP:flavonoid glycosyltransferase YjiC (YdhE family)